MLKVHTKDIFHHSHISQYVINLHLGSLLINLHTKTKLMTKQAYYMSYNQKQTFKNYRKWMDSVT